MVSSLRPDRESNRIAARRARRFSSVRDLRMDSNLRSSLLGELQGAALPYSVSPKHDHIILFQSSAGRARGSGTSHPCVSVSISGQIACFVFEFGQLSKFGFGPRMDTDTHGWNA